ncbi:LssY C-terminal domain-containing protein [Diaminobutyricibacter sp. McL0618]|uniref:LssY C-terminal domain-containing protein n=1 Tax=Leifsonia sp. McL0618 TaxID=3415677 RepID=UPI003CE9BA3D
MPRTPVAKTRTHVLRSRSPHVVADSLFFVFGGVSAVWLAIIVLTESFRWGWFLILFFLLFWVMLAYLVLPRLHRILTSIYVPDYFIGRTRTSDGLLGDPINLALNGSDAQVDAAMRRANWIRADEVTLASSRRIITSTLFRRSYDEAPVSPLLLFGHQQDLAYQQEVQGNPAKRHHVRFWRTPDGWLLPGGHRVEWLAAGTFDRAVGFSLFTLQITHKIDANTDVERDHIVSTLTAADAGVEVDVLRDFSTGYHARNGGGDTIETDGDLPVVDVRAVIVGKESLDVAAEVAASRLARTQERPIPTSLGFLLMLLRVVAGLVFIGLTAVDFRGFLEAEVFSQTSSITPEQQTAATWIVAIFLAVVGLWLLLYLWMAILVYRGSDRARVIAMSLSSLAIIVTAVDFFTRDAPINLQNNILGLPLDILVVLALSSQRSRDWARRVRAKTSQPSKPSKAAKGGVSSAASSAPTT